MDFDPKMLDRFFNGTYSRKDYFKIRSAFRNLECRSELTQYLEKHWNYFSSGEMPPGNVDHILDKIYHKIQLEENSSRKISLFSVFQKVAAILIIPLLLSFFAVFYFKTVDNTDKSKEQTYNSVDYAEIQCPLGVRTEFQLPDGTIGFLNSGSRLQYPVRFSGGRNVTVAGEAYFDVTTDKQNPFIVSTSNLNITVTGTQLNIIAYEDEQKEEVILSKGEVEVALKDGTKLEVLQPNCKLALNTEEQTYSTTKVVASQYSGWTEGKLIFRNENMKQLAERLGRWYNVEIIIKNEELLEYTFHATFIDEPLEEVLKYIALTTPYTYEILPRETDENDICKKRIVLVKLDRERLKAFK